MQQASISHLSNDLFFEGYFWYNNFDDKRAPLDYSWNLERFKDSRVWELVQNSSLSFTSSLERLGREFLIDDDALYNNKHVRTLRLAQASSDEAQTV